MRSYKRLGSKAAIPPYTGIVSEEKQGGSREGRSRVANKENNFFGTDKKKLKRIGKKAWVSAFKQTIEEGDFERGQIKPINSDAK